MKSLLAGFAGTIVLLGIYFGTLTGVSGWNFAIEQFSQFWYYIISLTVGFGLQIGLFIFLRHKTHQGSKKMVAVSGVTSTGAMVSCCAHYLVNFLPLLGTSGVLTLIGQYQKEFFWLGLGANALGIMYLVRKINE